MTVYEYKIPDVRYNFYKYIIAINHFQNVLHIIENQINGEPGEIERIETLLNSRNFAIYSFKAVGDENQNITDDQYKEMVSKGQGTLLQGRCIPGCAFAAVLTAIYR